jgi:hypothetical protein
MLFQSLAMIVCQLVMLYICTKYPSKNEKGLSSKKTGGNVDIFNLENFASYLILIGGFTAISGFVTILFIQYSLYVELLGFLALGIEAMLGTPQVWRNYINKSTKGLRLVNIFHKLI